MANRYVRSGAAGAGTGADWANAYTTLALAIAGAVVAGDDIWVSEDHAESTAGAVTLTFPGTDVAPNRVICVDHAGSVPPVAADLRTTATVTTTGNNSLIVQGNVSKWYGVNLVAGSGGTSTVNLNTCTSSSAINFEGCYFKIGSTGGSSRIVPGGAVHYRDCSMEFSSTAQGFSISANPWTWDNRPGVAAITGAVLPTSLVASAGNLGTDILWSGLDLSALGAGKTLFPAAGFGRARLVNCKLGASVTAGVAPNNRRFRGVDVLNSDSGATNYRNERYRYQGTLTTETTIKRTGGASDGTTSYSHKIVTTANAKREDPFETFEGSLWNDTTGASKTLSIHFVTDNVTLKDSEIWLEVEHLGSSDAPITSLISDGAATILTAGADQASSTETWTTTGLTTPVKQKANVTFTPQMKGLIRWRLRVGRASTTVYVCPKPEIS